MQKKYLNILILLFVGLVNTLNVAFVKAAVPPPIKKSDRLP